MNSLEQLDALRRTASEHVPLLALGAEVRWAANGKSLVALPAQLDERVRMRLALRSGRVFLTAEGADDEMRRLLRNVLIGEGELRSEPREHLLLKAFGKQEQAAPILDELAYWAQFIEREILVYRSVVTGQMELPQDKVLGYWWDSKPNFGDTAGPWLVKAMTGRSVINARHSKARGSALASVGSMFQMLNRSQIQMWGSGMLYQPAAEQLKKVQRLQNISVHAVRGPKTRKVLQDAYGWEVPEVYGDPALLYPRYFTPRAPRQQGQIAFVPHYQHVPHFRGLGAENISLARVAEDVETVVSTIATAEVCVSTSLHGIIFAQAYGVPWVWLNVQDNELKGGEFKFEDFFSTLDPSAVARYDTRVEELGYLDLEKVASTASLPALRIDLDALEAAFPLPREEYTPSTREFDWSAVPGEEIAVAHARAAYRTAERVRPAEG